MSRPFTFIHTSDWHLGLSIYDHDSIGRQEAMLRRIAEIADERKPDAVLVSGDVLNSAQPPVWAGRVLAEGLVAIRKAGGPDMRIIVTAGNHDSAARHESMRELWRFAGVEMVGHVSRGTNGSPEAVAEANERLIFEIPGCGYVLAVPYVNERNMPRDFYASMLAEVERRNVGGLPVVMMAHCSVGDEAYFRHVADDPAPDSVGGIDVCSLQDMGEGFDYLALGHIHRPATFRIPDSPAVARYCGTPLAVSFDERFNHSVSLVSIEGHGEDAVINIEKIPVHDPCPPVNIPAEGFAAWDDCMAELEVFPASRPCLLRLNVLVDDYLHPEAREEALAALEGKAGELCIINSRRRPRECGAAGDEGFFTISEFRELQPFDLALRYAADAGLDFGPELQEAFKEILTMEKDDEDTKA